MNYFITAISYVDDGQFPPTRTFGYFTSMEEAKDAVMRNGGDMHEYYYNYIVIESIGPGIFASSDEKAEAWFKFNPETEAGNWEPCEKPHWSEQTINWAM